MRAVLAWRRRAYAVLAGTLAAAVATSGLLTPIDDAVRAAYVRNAPVARKDATVLIAIDDRSLQQLGQWPWPRHVHARLIQRLHDAGAGAIALDVLMPEPDRYPHGDQALAHAMLTSGQVVLPVSAAAEDSGLPEELLPASPLVRAAHALGHNDLGGAEDGALALAAGVGSPRWPSLALALLDTTRSGPTRSHTDAPASRAWVVGDRVLLRFAGPAGTYPRHSYVDVLEGRVPPAAFRGRRVIVGATAAGLGHVVVTPMAGQAMSTLEYLANAADTLASRAEARPIGAAPSALIAGVLAAVSVLTGFRLTPGARLVVVTAVTAAVLVGSTSGLSAAGVWWGPSAAIAIMVAAAFASSTAEWRRQAEEAGLDGVSGLLSRRRFLTHLRSQAAVAADSGETLVMVSLRVRGLPEHETSGIEGAVLLSRLAHDLLASMSGTRDFAGRIGAMELAAVAVGLRPPAVDALLGSLKTRVDVTIDTARTAAGLERVEVVIRHAAMTSDDVDAWPRLLRRATVCTEGPARV